jgi:hypothetical protein
MIGARRASWCVELGTSESLWPSSSAMQVAAGGHGSDDHWA